MEQVAIAFGSNLGDRRAAYSFAIDRLRTSLHTLEASSLIETDPVGVEPQPRFLNGAIAGGFHGTPRALLDLLQEVELAAGRSRPHPGAPRTLDLDLVLFGSLIVEEPGLEVPHPRFRDREFVLAPLAEIRPGFVDPVTGLTVAELLLRQRAAPGR